MPVTHYIWDPETDAYVMETDSDGNTTAVYTQEPKPYGSLISQRRGGVDSYYQQDALGSTRQLTNDSEVVTDSYIYSAYGETMASSGSTVNPFRWIGGLGYYFDAETGGYYVRARNFSPRRGRWISFDPLLFVDGLNLLAAYFVPNSVDPAGTDWLDCMAACIQMNDPANLAAEAMIAQLAVGFWPKELFAAIAEAMGDAHLAEWIRKSAEVGSNNTTMPRALQLLLKRNLSKAFNVLSKKVAKSAGPILTAYGLALAAVETHCTGICCAAAWYGLDYDHEEMGFLDTLRDRYFGDFL